jgi:hypothetical protein
MQAGVPGIRRLCVGVDLKRYSDWTTPQQIQAQRGLDEMLTTMWERAGVNRQLCARLPGGDGEFLLLPPGIDEPAVVAALIKGTQLTIAEANLRQEALPDGVRLRVRMAMHEGVSHHAELGFAGQVVIALRRMLDSAPLRRALDSDQDRILAVALSDPVFQDSVAQQYQELDPEEFHTVRLEDAAHGFDLDAWMHVPGDDRRATDTADPSAFNQIQGVPGFAMPTDDDGW